MPACGGRDGSFSVACFRDHIDYVENQCSKPLPDCSYTVGSRDVTVIANDDILYSRTVQDCQRFCDDVSGTIIILYFPFLLKKIRCYTVKLTHSHNIVWTIQSVNCDHVLCRREHSTAAVSPRKVTAAISGIATGLLTKLFKYFI